MSEKKEGICRIIVRTHSLKPQVEIMKKLQIPFSAQTTASSALFNLIHVV